MKLDVLRFIKKLRPKMEAKLSVITVDDHTIF